MARSDNNDSKNELYCSILDDLEDRENWENRQVLWHKMRTDGVKRARKPWAGAADMHVPLGDTIINKLKAYYMQWIFGPELLASFYSLESQGDSYTDSVAQWFDYKVRECSNFALMAMCAIDSTLQNGMGIVKTYWDVKKNRLAFDSIHPYFVIVPPNTKDLNSADRVTHVMHISEADYRRSGESRGYNMDEDFIESITGEGKPDKRYEEQRYTAEGLSHTGLDDLIILWEVYVRDDDDRLTVNTFSPLQPDEPARAEFRMPYEHRQVPLVQIPYELMDPGFYTPRGIMHLVQMFEASANKMWNEKLDFMSIANRPVLSSQGGSINAQNVRWEPGAVYDSVLQLVTQPAPPVDFDQEIQNNRSLAEQRVGIPDFGVGDQKGSQGTNKTATETNVITGVMQQSNDLRARLTKNAITSVFEQAWSILKQYDKKSLDYFWRKQRLTLEDAAFDSAYVLRPNGSVDGYSREKEIQKLMQLRQMAEGSPWIKVPEIDRKIIELMDSQWISQVYEDPQAAQQDEAQNQAIENSVMCDGFLSQVKPSDDHVTHLQIWDGFLKWAPQHGRQLPPDIMDIFMQHGTAHVAAARQDHHYMEAHGPQIAQFAQQIAATQKQMQQMQMAQQHAGMAMQSLRGGAPPMASGNGMPPGAPPPPAPPQPGMPAGVGPQMPPVGLPPGPNGAP